MNLRKKPFSISLQALAGVLIFSCLLAHPFSEAASSPPGDKRDYLSLIHIFHRAIALPLYLLLLASAVISVVLQ